MRLRMQRELGSRDAESFDLKQDPGGIADIEFLVQYGALRWADRLGSRLRFTDNVRLLEGFAASGLLLSEEAEVLGDAYRAFRARVHELDLQGRPARVAAEEMREHREAVRSAWRRWME
jgi:glutamate-ammonia-ligase adenylyltransferase